MKAKEAIQFINKQGILLVYPIDNRPEPKSIWSEFYPKSKMKWEWDTGGDDRVARLWHLREELSSSGKVVYAKWYQGRATFFSKEVFAAVYYLLNKEKKGFSEDAQRILEVLELNSPTSGKTLKKVCEMTGKTNERRFEKALKELWQKLQVVGYGEIDDGAFPSLAIGSTKLLFKDLVTEAKGMSEKEAYKRLSIFKEGNLLLKFLSKLLAQKEKTATKQKKRIHIIRGADLIK